MLILKRILNVIGLIVLLPLCLHCRSQFVEQTPPTEVPPHNRIDNEDTTSSQEYCHSQNFGNYHYNRTRVGTYAYSTEKCENGGYPKGFVFCALVSSSDGPRAMFEESSTPNEIDDCDENIDDVLSKISPDDITNGVLEHIGQLQVLTANASKLNISQVSKIIKALEAVENATRNSQLQIITSGSLRSMVSVLSQLTETYDMRENLSKRSGNTVTLRQSTAKLLPSLCLLSSFDVYESKWKFKTDNFLIEAEDHDLEDPLIYSPDVSDKNNITLPSTISLSLPASVFKNARNGLEPSSSVRTVIIQHESDILFPSNQKALNILSVDVGLNESANSNLEEPIVIKHLNVNETQGKSPIPGNRLMVKQTKFQCVFWDFTTSSWSEEGCVLNDTDGVTECQCSHLTNFALLVVSKDVPANFTLEIVSLVGCCLSIIALFVTVLVLALRRDLRKHRPGKILLHLCFNLCISYIIFVSGVSNAVGNPAACTAVTFFLHYFFLVSWAWMGIYSYEMYIQVVKVFDTYHTRFMIKAGSLCYSVPAAIALVTGGGTRGFSGLEAPSVQHEGQYHADNVCWLQGYGLYFGFLLPIGLVLITNLVVFTMVICELRSKKVISPGSRCSTRRHKELLLIATTATFTMGLTWVFGYILLITRNEAVFTAVGWLFALSSSLQGFGIFSLTILRRGDLRRAWWNSIRKFCGSQSYKLPRIHSSASSSAVRLTSARSSRTSLSRQSTKISFSPSEREIIE